MQKTCLFLLLFGYLVFTAGIFDILGRGAAIVVFSFLPIAAGFFIMRGLSRGEKFKVD